MVGLLRTTTNVVELKKSLMNKQNQLHGRLLGYREDLISKLKLVCREGQVDIWMKRYDKPNLNVRQFKLCIKKLKKKRINKITWSRRESEAGVHGLLGEDECFKFESDITLMGLKKKYFIKGYFFNKGDLKGVCVQSFRDIPLLQIK